MASTTHRTYVQVQGPYFVAACEECGTSGFHTRAMMEHAEADASAHGVLEHLAPREDLLAQAKEARSQV